MHEKVVALAGTPENWENVVADCLQKIAYYWEVLEREDDDIEEVYVDGDWREQANAAVLRIINTPVSRPEHVSDKLKVVLERGMIFSLREEEVAQLVALLSTDLSRAAARLREAELA